MSLNTEENKKVGSALVLGGGIGGMQAALDLAESGLRRRLRLEQDYAFDVLPARRREGRPQDRAEVR